jgi:acetoin utilization deacetylase AcuC-like enzyme
LSKVRYNYEKDRRIKEKLLEYVISIEKEHGVDDEEYLSLMEKMVEWLEEDFGISVEKDWGDISEAVINHKEISAKDLAIFLVTEGITVDESLWFQ